MQAEELGARGGRVVWFAAWPGEPLEVEHLCVVMQLAFEQGGRDNVDDEIFELADRSNVELGEQMIW